MNNIESALKNTFSIALEELAFAEIDTWEFGVDMPEPGEKLFWGVIDVLEPEKGELLITISREHLNSLTEEMYGFMTEEISFSTLKDALGEFINTISGLLISEIIPKDKKFTLGIPKTGKGAFPVMTNPVASISLVIESKLIFSCVGGKSDNIFQKHLNL